MLEYGTIMTGWDELDRFLRTDPRDVGCDKAVRLLHVYVELVLDDESGAEQPAGTLVSPRTCSAAARAPRTTRGLLQAARANPE
jgi:hypothetical protein